MLNIAQLALPQQHVTPVILVILLILLPPTQILAQNVLTGAMFVLIQQLVPLVLPIIGKMVPFAQVIIFEMREF